MHHFFYLFFLILKELVMKLLKLTVEKNKLLEVYVVIAIIGDRYTKNNNNTFEIN